MVINHLLNLLTRMILQVSGTSSFKPIWLRHFSQKRLIFEQLIGSSITLENQWIVKVNRVPFIKMTRLFTRCEPGLWQPPKTYTPGKHWFSGDFGTKEKLNFPWDFPNCDWYATYNIVKSCEGMYSVRWWEEASNPSVCWPSPKFSLPETNTAPETLGLVQMSFLFGARPPEVAANC